MQAVELQRQLQLRDLVISRLVPQAEVDRVCMWTSAAPELRTSVVSKLHAVIV